MLTELALTHHCDQTIHWSAGGVLQRRRPGPHALRRLQRMPRDPVPAGGAIPPSSPRHQTALATPSQLPGTANPGAPVPGSTPPPGTGAPLRAFKRTAAFRRRATRVGPEGPMGETATGLPMSSQCPHKKADRPTVSDLRRTERARPSGFGTNDGARIGGGSRPTAEPPVIGTVHRTTPTGPAPVCAAEHRRPLKVPPAGPGVVPPAGVGISMSLVHRQRLLGRKGEADVGRPHSAGRLSQDAKELGGGGPNLVAFIVHDQHA